MRSRRGGPPEASRAALPLAYRPRRARPQPLRAGGSAVRGVAERDDALPGDAPGDTGERVVAALQAVLTRSRAGTSASAGAARPASRTRKPARSCPVPMSLCLPLSPARRCSPGTPGGGGPAPGDTRTYAQHTGRMRARRPGGRRRTPPPRHPAPTGPSGTGQHGRRTSAAARTPAGSARASGQQLPLIVEQGPVRGQLVQAHQHTRRFASIRG